MTIKVKKLINRSFKDHRGYYWTSWKSGLIKKLKFKHDKFSLSKKNVLRGLHGDNKTWKLVSCPYGKFLLVVVNCIKKSKDYLKCKSWIISQKNGVKILGEKNLLNKLPISSSNLYAKNLFNFVLNLYDKENKKIKINLEDEIINKTLVK